MTTTTCKTCKTVIDHLEAFPGNVCLTCWAASPAGRYIPTAHELSAAFGAAIR